MFGNKETTSQGSFEERTNIAAGMELAVEPGRHFSYFFRGNYPPSATDGTPEPSPSPSA